MKGIVKAYNSEKSYGFIRCENGKEYFMHISDVESNTRSYPSKGQEADFDYRDTPKGPRAINVKLSN